MTGVQTCALPISGIFCGKAWVEEVYRQLGNKVELTWFVKDGMEEVLDSVGPVLPATGLPVDLEAALPLFLVHRPIIRESISVQPAVRLLWQRHQDV